MGVIFWVTRWGSRALGGFMLLLAALMAYSPGDAVTALKFAAIGAFLMALSFNPKLRRRAAAMAVPKVAPAIAATPAPDEPMTARAVIVGPFDRDVLLSYLDSHGAATSRHVTLHELHGHEDAAGHTTWEHVRGYCHLRRQARTFRLSRVRSAAEPSDGEIIEDLPRWLLAAAPAATTHTQ